MKFDIKAFREVFPQELLANVIDNLVQIHDGCPLGYHYRARYLWEYTSLIQHRRRSNYESSGVRRYQSRHDFIQHDGFRVLKIQKVIETAFGCTQLKFYDIQENWNLTREIGRFIGRIQECHCTIRFKHLYVNLTKLVLALQYQRWWATLAWTLYYRSILTAEAVPEHLSYPYLDMHLGCRGSKWPQSPQNKYLTLDAKSYMMDNRRWNELRSNDYVGKSMDLSEMDVDTSESDFEE